MKKSEFIILCESLMIHPAIALENEAVREALASKNDARVKEALETEF